MGVEQVSNTKPAVKTNGVTVSGENGAKLSKPEEQLAKLPKMVPSLIFLSVAKQLPAMGKKAQDILALDGKLR